MQSIGEGLIFLCSIQLTGGLILTNGARKTIFTIFFPGLTPQNSLSISSIHACVGLVSGASRGNKDIKKLHFISFCCICKMLAQLNLFFFFSLVFSLAPLFAQ